jgi:hypothetical protein
MEQSKFLETLRRAFEIKFKADFGFHTLRGINDDLNYQVRALREAEQQLNTYRNAPDHHGSKWQRENIARLVDSAQAEVDEQAIAVEVIKALQQEAQDMVNTFAPQRDAVMKVVDQLRNERNAFKTEGGK